jgi:hypothetical protein
MIAQKPLQSSFSTCPYIRFISWGIKSKRQISQDTQNFKASELAIFCKFMKKNIDISEHFLSLNVME